ncbi:MAG TPA: DUF4328 domain-containing protein, partial [Acidimicrobiales bacterium]|nr:DUF4328 domain-containing protein [Acidimicrobiales bacterium]
AVADQGGPMDGGGVPGGPGWTSPSVPAAPPGAYPAPWGGMGWWDGYQWSQLPMVPVYVDPYEPVTVLGRAVQVLFGALVALKVVNLVIDVVRFGNAKDLDLANQSLDSLLGGGNGAAVGVSLITSLVTLATIVVFLVWRHRIQRNLRGPLGVAGLEQTPGWAVGWWFVPIANLWKPKQGMDEAWRASAPDVPVGAHGWAGRPSSPLIGWWWGVWILSWFVGIDFRISDGDTFASAGEIRFGIAQEMLGLGLSALAAYFALRVVGGLTARHRARAHAFGLADG